MRNMTTLLKTFIKDKTKKLLEKKKMDKDLLSSQKECN